MTILGLCWLPFTGQRGRVMGIEQLSDETVLSFYECIRHQVAMDQAAGLRLVAESAKQRAQQLRQEIERRRLRCDPIDWPVL